MVSREKWYVALASENTGYGRKAKNRQLQTCCGQMNVVGFVNGRGGECAVGKGEWSFEEDTATERLPQLKYITISKYNST